MKLYYFDTLQPRKVCAAAKYLKAPVEYVYVDLLKGEQRSPGYLALNPNGKVPTLTDGERTLWEADAIMCALAARMSSDLWPHDARQIEIIRWFSWNSQHFNRAGGALYFEHMVKARFRLGEPNAAEVERALQDFRGHAGILNDHLRGKRWLLGDSLTLADFSVAGVLPFAEGSHMPVREFPEVSRWHEQLNTIEAWRNPYPARQQDAA
jgi:glutathione S-transferase